jgi:hypothetical protein
LPLKIRRIVFILAVLLIHGAQADITAAVQLMFLDYIVGIVDNLSKGVWVAQISRLFCPAYSFKSCGSIGLWLTARPHCNLLLSLFQRFF